MDDWRRDSNVSNCSSSAPADALAALAAVTAGKPLPSNDAWVPTFENRRESADSLRWVQENSNW
jgi:hypothetical protein